MSTSTWSLRERPEWIFLPISPRRRVRSSSTCEWISSTSSSRTKSPSSISLRMSSSPSVSFTSSSLLSKPMLSSILICAFEPSTSYFASLRSRILSFPTVNSSTRSVACVPLLQSVLDPIIIILCFLCIQYMFRFRCLFRCRGHIRLFCVNGRSLPDPFLLHHNLFASSLMW